MKPTLRRCLLLLLLAETPFARAAQGQDGSTVPTAAVRGERDQAEGVKPVARVVTEALAERTLSATVEGLGTVGGSARRTFDVTFARPVVLGEVAVVPGQVVRAGERLLDLPPDPAAGLAFRQASLALKAAHGELARVTDLYSRQLATRGQLAAAERAVAEAKAVAAEQRQMGAGDAITEFKSPFDAVVLTVSAAPGSRVPPGTPVMQLGPAACAEVAIGIEPPDARGVRPGMPAFVTAALDDSQTARGVVARVGGAVNATSQLVDAWLKLEACPFLAGTKVLGRIEIRSVTGLAVPRSAVLADESGRYVFVTEAKRAKRVDVKTLLEDQELVAVAGSLKAGMRIVTMGNYELEAGMAVSEEAAPDDKPGAEKTPSEGPPKVGEH